jgi:hypothetical protein
MRLVTFLQWNSSANDEDPSFVQRDNRAQESDNDAFEAVRETIGWAKLLRVRPHWTTAGCERHDRRGIVAVPGLLHRNRNIPFR